MRRRAKNGWGTLASLVVLAASLRAQGGPPAWPGDGGVERAAVRTAVVVELRGSSQPSADLSATLERLGALTPLPVPELFQLLWAGAVPDAWIPADEPPLALGPLQHALLVDAFRALPIQGTMDWLSSLERDVSDPAPRLTALRLLGSIARPTELRLMTRFATMADDATDSSFSLAYRRSLAALIERHPGTLGLLSSMFVELPDVLIDPTVDAVETARVTGRVAALARLLGRMPSADPLILAVLARVAQEEPAPFAEEARSNVRLLLGRGDPATSVLAARAAGVLRDTEAVPGLIALLAERSSNVRNGAHAALVTIIDQDLGSEAFHWEHWFEAERSWWHRDSQEHIAALLVGSAADAVAAVKVLARHRLFSEELARRILRALERPEPELVALVARLLGDLGSREAVEPLRRALREGPGSVLAERELRRALERLAPSAPTPRTP